MLCTGFISCTGTKEVAHEGFTESNVEASAITSQIPDYQKKLQTLQGKGRAIVSEPGNTERVTIEFSSNRSKSMVTVRNNVGVEGGQLLTDGDTLLVYNKVEDFARRIPIRGGNLDRINQLASLNILDMISYSVAEEDVQTVSENPSLYKLELTSGTEIFVDKETYLIQEVIQPEDSLLPYSKITYDAYGSIEGFKLPRRISIFGAEEESKVSLQLTALELNPQLEKLIIDLPDDIPIYHK